MICSIPRFSFSVYFSNRDKMFIQSSRCCKADCINVSKLKLNLKTFHCPCLLSLTSKSCYIGGVVTFSRPKNSLDFLFCVSTFFYRTGRTFQRGVVSQKLCLLPYLRANLLSSPQSQLNLYRPAISYSKVASLWIVS